MKFCNAKLQRIFSEGKNAKELNHEQNDDNKQKNKPPQFFLAKFILTTLILTLALISCSDNGGNNTDSTSNGGSISGSTIVSGASVTYDLKYFENADDMNEAKKATDFNYLYYDCPLSDDINAPVIVKVNNGKVTISLGTPKSEYMGELYDFDDNPMNVKAYGDWGDSDNDDFTFFTENIMYALVCMKDKDNHAFLGYVDRDVTLKDTYTSEYSDYKRIWNASLKKGWNYFIWSHNNANTYTITASTTQPSGFNWTVISADKEFDRFDY
jgi:hypothetical protein